MFLAAIPKRDWVLNQLNDSPKKMPHLSINNANLWYDTLGEGEPLLLHHGYAASRENWLPVAEILKKHYQVVVIESRGCGESEHTESGYTLEQYALDAVELMRHLGHERFSFAGHSMGGGVGMTLAIKHPDKLEKLVLMASVGSTGLVGDGFMANVEARLEARRNKDQGFFEQEYSAGLFRPEVQTKDWKDLRVHHLMNVVSDTHLIDSMKSMQTMDYGDDLKNIDIPTLVLSGGVDSLLNTNLDDCRRLPNACRCSSGQPMRWAFMKQKVSRTLSTSLCNMAH
jgi:pimeloyl-ACP methyl ester carboxylesterase